MKMKTAKLILTALCAGAMAACTPAPETTSAPGAGEGSVAQANIEDVEWHLVELNGSPVTGRREAPTLTLASGEKRAAGFAGCNRFFGSYALGGSTVRFSAIGATRMACAEDGAMELESAYLKALESAESFTSSGETLTLSGGGSMARFARART